MKSPLPALATACLTLLACASAFAGLADRTLDIYWVDVEGGGATLIVTPAGDSILIDSGNPFERDPGRIHKLATEVAGLKKIDHLVTTHFHVDHFGGAAELSALLPIGQVHDKGIPEADPDGRPNNQRWPITIAPYRNFKPTAGTSSAPATRFHSNKPTAPNSPCAASRRTSNSSQPHWCLSLSKTFHARYSRPESRHLTASAQDGN